ncbi:MAG TPA: hypothetical protein VFG43_04680 [Geminicoccaceae bacterium]|nr:hypothetical protein [Geminicoccaceae bacterium]
MRTDAASEPTSGSVRANEPMISPDASFGKYLCFCSSVPSMTMPCEPMPLLVPISERNAGEVCPSSKATSTSSSMVSPSPPYSSGIDSPNNPSSRISRTIGSGTASSSARRSSFGTRRSRTKRRTASSSWLRVSRSRAIIPLLFSEGGQGDTRARFGARTDGHNPLAGQSGGANLRVNRAEPDFDRHGHRSGNARR